MNVVVLEAAEFQPWAFVRASLGFLGSTTAVATAMLLFAAL